MQYRAVPAIKLHRRHRLSRAMNRQYSAARVLTILQAAPFLIHPVLLIRLNRQAQAVPASLSPTAVQAVQADLPAAVNLPAAAVQAQAAADHPAAADHLCQGRPTILIPRYHPARAVQADLNPLTVPAVPADRVQAAADHQAAVPAVQAPAAADLPAALIRHNPAPLIRRSRQHPAARAVRYRTRQVRRSLLNLRGNLNCPEMWRLLYRTKQ